MSQRRYSDRRPATPLDLKLTQRYPTGLAKRELAQAGDIDTPPRTPASATESIFSAPTTPNGHPLSRPAYFRPRVDTPVPIVKILPLCVARVSEGLIFAVIFPYINEMMHDFGVPQESVGIWSATAESTLMVTEALAAPLYAPLADRFGRRPVFIPLVFMWGVFALAFGFASSPWGVVFYRAALGLLAGAGVLSRTMTGELCDKTNRIKGFALFSPAFTIGVTIAPLIGGFLSRPVPGLFSESWTLLVEYPYLLPSVVVGFSGFAAAGLGYIFLPETLPSGLRESSTRHEEEKASSAGGLANLLRYRKFQHVLVLYGLTNCVMFSWEAVFPLFAFTRVELGGLGLTTPQIGVILAFSAGLSIVMTIWLFPIAHRHFEEATMLRLCQMMYPIATTLFPLLWALNRGHEGKAMPVSACCVLGVQMVLRRTGDFASTLLDTIVLDAIPGPEYLAMANSITFSMAAVGRAIGPFIVSSFFALATTSESAFSPKRQLVWFVFALISMPSVYMAQRVVDDDTMAADAASDEENHELLGTESLNGSALDDDEDF